MDETNTKFVVNDLITVKEAAQLAGVCVGTIHRWVSVGHIPCYLVGRSKIKFSKEELIQWLKPKPMPKKVA